MRRAFRTWSGGARETLTDLTGASDRRPRLYQLFTRAAPAPAKRRSRSGSVQQVVGHFDPAFGNERAAAADLYGGHLAARDLS